MIDFNGESLPALANELEAKYAPLKVTAVTADAASEEAIAGVCQQAIKDNGRLDHFFANAGIVGMNLLNSTDPDEFMEVFRVNTLS